MNGLLEQLFLILLLGTALIVYGFALIKFLYRWFKPSRYGTGGQAWKDHQAKRSWLDKLLND